MQTSLFSIKNRKVETTAIRLVEEDKRFFYKRKDNYQENINKQKI